MFLWSAPLFLARPIPPPANDAIDVTYRFGSTQGGLRDPHHGVEFLNPYGTPVHAAADGEVIVAGTDLDPTSPRGVWPITFLGPYSNFYGQPGRDPPAAVPEGVQTARWRPGDPNVPQPIYTLYGHLSEIRVQVGQHVSAGQQIGKVGQAGSPPAATYTSKFAWAKTPTKPPATRSYGWRLASKPEASRTGAIAGRFLDSYENQLEMDSIVLEHLPDGPQGTADLSHDAADL